MITPEQQEQLNNILKSKGVVKTSEAPAVSAIDRVISNAQAKAKENYQASSPYQTGNKLTSPTISYNKGDQPVTVAAKAAVNIPTSGARVVSDIAKAAINVFNPDFLWKGTGVGESKNTLVNIANLGVGLLEKGTEMVTGKKMTYGSDTKMVDAVAGALKERYGSAENVQRTIAEDPVGVLTDIATILEGGGAALQSTKIAPLAKAGTVVKVAGETINPLRIGSKVVGSATEKVGEVMKGAGERTMRIAAPMQPSTARMVQSYQAAKPTLIERVQGMLKGEPVKVLKAPIREADTAARLGIAGTEWGMGVQGKKVASNLWKEVVDPALKGSKTKVDMRSFLSDWRKEIIAKTPELGRRQALLKAMDAIESQYKKVGKINLKKLQEYKEGWAKPIPESYYKGKPISGSMNEVRSIGADMSRNIIRDSLGEQVKQAYIDYGNLKSIQEAGIKSVDALRSKGVTKQVWEFIADKAITPVASYGSKVLYKTGEGLEFVGNQGLKKVGDLFRTETLTK